MESARHFPTTMWTLVLSAGRQTDAQSSEALASLCEKYWYPLYAYIRRRGYPVEQAQDLTQEFFVRVLEKRYIGRADRSKARFRTFLLSSLTYFLCDEVDRQRALKRGGTHTHLPFEVRDGEEIYRREPSHSETPEKIFERRWALVLLDRVLARLGEEFADRGKRAHFERLKVFLLGQRGDVPYAELARELETTEGALKVAAHRLRTRYRHLLRAEIAETVAGSADIDGEIRYLAAALAGKSVSGRVTF
jgi:RNA polymerase sigma-70 factor (ECF subfamily)